MDIDLLNKALALCSEIEERQAQLKEILSSLTELTVPSEILEHSESTGSTEPSECSETSELSDISQPTPIATVSGDLRKAFTINDRFRFRRELFGGDDKAMMDVIAHLSDAQTFADAQAYLDTLAWDADNEAVAEFKDIVSTFFNGYRI
ncbi:MAG: hypothetical protein K2J10_00275 [Muribaculaceae bacterium]|nr:hypothetical protein [Muribaculaceae bacterium]